MLINLQIKRLQGRIKLTLVDNSSLLQRVRTLFELFLSPKRNDLRLLCYSLGKEIGVGGKHFRLWKRGKITEKIIYSKELNHVKNLINPQVQTLSIYERRGKREKFPLTPSFRRSFTFLIKLKDDLI